MNLALLHQTNQLNNNSYYYYYYYNNNNYQQQFLTLHSTFYNSVFISFSLSLALYLVTVVLAFVSHCLPRI